MNNTEILAIYGTEYKEMTKTLLKEANLAEQIPDKDCRIGIKPNLVSPSEASWGATTHPEIVEGIIEYLQEHGFFNLVMLEGSWVGDKTAEAAELCGYYDLSRNYQDPKHRKTAFSCHGTSQTNRTPGSQTSSGLHCGRQYLWRLGLRRRG